VIQINRISKKFGERVILNDITLDLPLGKTVALLGPSGGGKSTLLRCLNGLCPVDEGEIRIAGEVLRAGLTQRSPEVRNVRRQWGMIFQDFQLFPHLNVLDNVIEAPMQVLGIGRGEAIEQAKALLDRVGMSSHLHAWPQQLSGGQKQRVAIARALAMQPRGLLCDEITSALDPELKSEVLNVLEDLRQDGLTLILVTHEMGFARRAADRVVVLCDGKILEDGAPAEVLETPRTERMRMFLRRVMG
jgi:polar amino acid transport system ATP-binding protein